MPLKWVPPALFHEHRGVKIYHAYKENEESNLLTYWFQWDKWENRPKFDVRDLPWYQLPENRYKGNNINVIPEALEHHIDQCLADPSCQLPWGDTDNDEGQEICRDHTHGGHDHEVCEYRAAVKSSPVN